LSILEMDENSDNVDNCIFSSQTFSFTKNKKMGAGMDDNLGINLLWPK